MGDRLRRAWAGSKVMLFLALVFVGEAVFGAVLLRSDAARGNAWVIVWDLILIAVGVINARFFFRRATRTGTRLAGRTLAAEFVAAARKIGARETWISRGDHVLFMADHGMGGTNVSVYSEDDLRAIDIDGRGAFISNMYIVARGTPRVIKITDGYGVTETGDGEFTLTGGRDGFWRRWRDALVLTRASAKGHLDVTAEEIRTVIGQLGRAELLGAGGLAEGDDDD